jgi:hypothetical protein
MKIQASEGGITRTRQQTSKCEKCHMISLRLKSMLRELDFEYSASKHIFIILSSIYVQGLR